MRKFSISKAIRANRKAGGHFFDDDTIRWFRSDIDDTVYEFFFVTSEQFDDDSPRRFTIRAINWDTGSIVTFGAFGQFEDLEDATEIANQLANEFTHDDFWYERTK